MNAESDAPLRSEIRDSGGAGLLLVRTLHDALREDTQAADLFREEITIARKSASVPGLVPIREADPERLVLARAYSPHGTLAGKIGLTSTEGLILHGRTALEALRALHSVGVVHGDPGPYNLVLAADERAFLADPGSCRRRFAQARGTGRLEAEDPEADFVRLLAWILRATTERPEGEPSRAQALEALSTGSLLERTAAFLDLASGIATLPGRPVVESGTQLQVRFVLGPAPAANLVEPLEALRSAGLEGLPSPVPAGAVPGAAAQATFSGTAPLTMAVQAVLRDIAQRGHPLQISVPRRDRPEAVAGPVRGAPPPQLSTALEERPSAQSAEAPLAYVPLIGIGVTARRLFAAGRDVAEGRPGQLGVACLRLGLAGLLLVAHLSLLHAVLFKVLFR